MHTVNDVYVEPKLKVFGNVGFYMDFGWNECAPRVHPRCYASGTKVKHRWNVNEIPMELGGAINVINVSLLKWLLVTRQGNR